MKENIVKNFIACLFLMFLLAFGINTKLAYGSDAFQCFESSEQEADAFYKLRTQVLCSNLNFEECRKALAFDEHIESQKKALQQASCQKKNIDQKQLRTLNPEIYHLSSSIAATTILLNRSQPLFGSSPSGVFSRRAYVNSALDYIHHMRIHTSRVTELAVAAVKKFPEEFPGITEEHIREIFPKHDDAKKFAHYKFSDGKPFFEKLYEFYGKRPPGELIQELNATDEKIMDDAIKKMGLDSKKEVIERLEKLADFVDRAMNEVTPEEFGRASYPESEAAARKGDIKLSQMAKYLEDNYLKITGHIQFEKPSPAEFFRLSQHALAEKRFKTLISSGRTLKEIGLRSFSGLSRVIAATAKTRSTQLIAGIALGNKFAKSLNFVGLMSYTPDTGCAELGTHDWTKVDGKCVAVSGLTPAYLKFLEKTPSDREWELNHALLNTCPLTKDNLEKNENNLFEQVQCHSDGAQLQLSEDKKMYVKFNDQGRVSSIDFTHFDLFSSMLNHSPSKLVFNDDGSIAKECYKTGRGRVETCSSQKINEQFRTKLSSLNYKIMQGISCCLGIKADFNQKISCVH